MIKSFIKKPVTVQAIQLAIDNWVREEMRGY